MNRKIEHIKFVRSDEIGYVEMTCNELAEKGYVFSSTNILGEKFIVTMIKYVEPVKKIKESEVLVPTKKPRTSKKVKLQVPDAI